MIIYLFYFAFLLISTYLFYLSNALNIDVLHLSSLLYYSFSISFSTFFLALLCYAFSLSLLYFIYKDHPFYVVLPSLILAPMPFYYVLLLYLPLSYFFITFISIFLCFSLLIYEINKERDNYKKIPYKNLTLRIIRSSFLIFFIFFAISLSMISFQHLQENEKDIEQIIYTFTHINVSSLPQMQQQMIEMQKKSYVDVANSSILLLMNEIYEDSQFDYTSKVSCLRKMKEHSDKVLDKISREVSVQIDQQKNKYTTLDTLESAISFTTHIYPVILCFTIYFLGDFLTIFLSIFVYFFISLFTLFSKKE